jgi:hypothetical protein
MAASETALEKQIILLYSQIGDLENMLNDSDEQLSDAVAVMNALREAMVKVKETSADMLERVTATSSRMQMVMTLHELATKTELNDEMGFIDESRKQIVEFRERIFPRFQANRDQLSIENSKTERQ